MASTPQMLSAATALISVSKVLADCRLHWDP